MLPLRLNRRFFTLLAVVMLCMSFLTITASAEANPPKDDVIIYTADPTEPKPTEAAPKPTTPKPTTPPETQPPAATAPTTPTTVKPVEPFTEGNAIAKDLQFHADTNKQFITIETRSGEIFYIIIDYDAPVDEKSEQFSTYFLNKVDDADLQALLEDGEKVEVCGCIDRCYAGHVNTTCPICAKNMTECVGREPEPSEEPTVPATEPVKEPEKKSNSGAVLAVLLMIVMVGVMGWYFLKNKMPNPKTKGDTDLDDYDYGMDEDDEDYAEFESYNEQEETESK